MTRPTGGFDNWHCWSLHTNIPSWLVYQHNFQHRRLTGSRSRCAARALHHRSWDALIEVGQIKRIFSLVNGLDSEIAMRTDVSHQILNPLMVRLHR